MSWAQKLERITPDPLPYWHPAFRDGILGERVWLVDCALRIHKEGHWTELARTARVGRTTALTALGDMADSHMAKRLGGGRWRHLRTDQENLDLVFRRRAEERRRERDARREAMRERKRRRPDRSSP